MPNSSNDNTLPESTYPPLERPVLTSQIPPYLLEKASDSDKYILQQLSVLTQFIPWSVEAHLNTNAAVRRTNGRLIQAENNISSIQGSREEARTGWKYVITVGSIIGGGIAFLVTVIEGLYYLGLFK